ncbi:MAG: hypothetical protein PHU56_01780 [Candidatus Pacebacteria bacterium]|nr:hypothetical protein [Candidatus Paceibacterota bacterium]
MTEAQILRFAKKKLIEKGSMVYIQVPFLSRCIDMVLLDGDEIISIEFKLHDWRKAVIQSKDHLLGVDKAYICIPARENPSDQLLETLKEHGIGLFFFYKESEPLKEILPAQKSNLIWPTTREWLLNTISYAK